MKISKKAKKYGDAIAAFIVERVNQGILAYAQEYGAAPLGLEIHPSTRRGINILVQGALDDKK